MIARRLQGVDADVHQRSASRQRFVQPPLGWISDVEAVVGQNDLDWPEVLLARHADGLLVVGFVAAAVRHHQLTVGFARGVDHLLTVGRRIRHRLFRQDMFARLMSANGVLGVHSVGEHDVNNVDLRIVLDRVVVLIVVDILRVHSVAQSQFVRFVGMAADQSHHLRFFTFANAGRIWLMARLPSPTMAQPNFFPGGSGTCTAAAPFTSVPARLAATSPCPTLVMNPRRVISLVNELDMERAP